MDESGGSDERCDFNDLGISDCNSESSAEIANLKLGLFTLHA